MSFFISLSNQLGDQKDSDAVHGFFEAELDHSAVFLLVDDSVSELV